MLGVESKLSFPKGGFLDPNLKILAIIIYLYNDNILLYVGQFTKRYFASDLKRTTK